jgi:hypothetical protein
MVILFFILKIILKFISKICSIIYYFETDNIFSQILKVMMFTNIFFQYSIKISIIYFIINFILIIFFIYYKKIYPIHLSGRFTSKNFIRKNKSYLHKYFQSCNESDVKCCICSKIFGKNSRGAQNNHMNNVHDIFNSNFIEKNNESNSKFSEDEINQLFLKFFISSGISYRIVENIYLKSIVKLLFPSFQLFSRIKLSNLIKQKLNFEKKKIIEKLQKNSSKISITSDGWTSNQNKQYQAITVHYVDDHFNLQNIIIGFELITADDNELTAAEKYYSLILNVLKEYKIEKKIISITTDNAAVMNLVGKYFYKRNNIIHMGCAAHQINLILQDSLIDHTDIIHKVKKIVTLTRRSPQLTNMLEFEANSRNIKFYKFKNSVKTRWCSTLHMIESVIKNRDLILNTSTQLKNSLDEEDFETLKDLSEFLKPFEECIEYLSSTSYPTLAIIFRVFFGMINIFKDYENDNNLKENFKTIIKQMRKKLFKYYGEINHCILIGSILNPNLKIRLLNEFQQTEQTIETLNEIFELYKTEYQNKNPKKLSEKKNKFLSLYMDDNSSDEEEKNEIEIYLEEKKTKQADVLNYWKYNQKNFPVLSLIARDYLAISSTSVPSERVFSRSGFLVNKYRNKLSPSSIKANILLNNWMNMNYLQNEEIFNEEDDEENENVDELNFETLQQSHFYIDQTNNEKIEDNKEFNEIMDDIDISSINKISNSKFEIGKNHFKINEDENNEYEDEDEEIDDEIDDQSFRANKEDFELEKLNLSFQQKNMVKNINDNIKKRKNDEEDNLKSSKISNLANVDISQNSLKIILKDDIKKKNYSTRNTVEIKTDPKRSESHTFNQINKKYK